jgi:hypothetical protein
VFSVRYEPNFYIQMEIDVFVIIILEIVEGTYVEFKPFNYMCAECFELCANIEKHILISGKVPNVC